MVKGVDFIGGVDFYLLDGDYKKLLVEIFCLVDKYGVGVDIYLYDCYEVGIIMIKEIICLMKEYGL